VATALALAVASLMMSSASQSVRTLFSCRLLGRWR
jgi:hypothetical protein